MGSMPLQSFTLVIRCAAQGCYIAKNGGRRSSRRPSVFKKRRPANHFRGGLTLDMDMTSLFAGLLDSSGDLIHDEPIIDPGLEEWLPAYFTAKDSEAGRVVDPTGMFPFTSISYNLTVAQSLVYKFSPCVALSFITNTPQ